jgi:hypothetical protein
MPIDDDAERDRRAAMTRNWAKERARAKAKRTPLPHTGFTDQRLTRKQVANRVQRAAGEALIDLRRQREESRS